MALKFDKIIDSENLVDEIDDSELDSIGHELVSLYEMDEQSRSEHKKQNEEWMKLAVQVAEEKSFPWPNAANIKYPLITIAAIQFAARAYPALVGGRSAVKGRVIGKPNPDTEAKAHRVGQYMSYQIHEEMEEWEEDMDRLLISLPIVGTVFKKSYFSRELERNISELVLEKDLVIDYYAKHINKAVRITHILYFYPNELEERMRSGFYRDIDLDNSPTPTVYGEQHSQYIHGVSDQAQGMTPPGRTSEGTPRVVLEMHTWLDLDDDGYKEPYIVTIDKDSNKILRISPNFIVDNVLVNNDGEIYKITPDTYFTNFVFIPDPESGIYGFGLGRLLGPINETVNTTINQLLDAGSLSNLQSGFLSRGIRMKGGAKPFTPGEWRVVNSTGQDLKQGIFPLPVREPSNVLFQLLGTMVTAGQQVAAVSDMMMGENPGQNQPATTTLRVLEEGLMVFSSVYKRVHRALKKEYQKIFKLNHRFMDMEKYFTVLKEGTEEEAVVYQQDFDPSLVDVVPESDPNIVSEAQRLVKAEALMQMAMGGMVNPQEATRRVLEAQEQAGIEQLMELPEPQPDFETQLKMEQFQHQQQMDQMMLQKDMMELEVLMFKDKANAILALAKAESLENKAVLDQIQTQLQAMDIHEKNLTDRLKLVNDLKIEEMKQKMQGKSKAAELLQKDRSDERKNYGRKE